MRAQAAHLLVAALPNYAGQPLVPPAKDPTAFAQQLQSDILSAVLPLWSHPRAGKLPAGVLQSLLSVLNVCAQARRAAAGAAPRVGTSRWPCGSSTAHKDESHAESPPSLPCTPQGVGHAAVLLRLAGPRPGAAPRQPAAPDPRLVRAIVDMGFSQVRPAGRGAQGDGAGKHLMRPRAPCANPVGLTLHPAHPHPIPTQPPGARRGGAAPRGPQQR
jgi:hypothetical protein